MARHITRTHFKYDGKGYLPKERSHIWSIDAKTGKATQLTDSEVWDEEEPAVSPDGKWIAFHSNRTPEPDLQPEHEDIFVMPVEGGEPRRIDTPVGSKSSPIFSPDGSRIAYYARQGEGNWWQNTSLWVVPIDGSGSARNLTGAHDVHIAAFTIADMIGAVQSPPAWSADGERISFQVDRNGSTELRSIAVETGKMEIIVPGPGTVSSPTLDASRNRIAYHQPTMTDLGQVWLKDLIRGSLKKLTDHNAARLRALELGTIEEVWFKGSDGTDLQGWVLFPPDFDESKMYPSILEIHGGPRAQYGHNFMHEFFLLAAAGYIVYFCNPRGSQGYGEAHSKAITNNWGTVDYDDVMAWADMIAKRPYIDTERLGVTGGSYGGYMTNWIIGHTDRFKAAATQRCVSNLVSMYGSSDGNWIFQREFGDRPPWESLENYWRMSPIRVYRRSEDAYAGNPQRDGQALRHRAGRAGIRGAEETRSRDRDGPLPG